MSNCIVIRRDTAKQDMTRLKNKIIEYLATGDTEIVVRRISKSREQEKLYHALIGEIAGQIRTYGKQYGEDVWKALLVDQFAKERELMGEPLRKPGTVVPAMDGTGRMVTVRPSTIDFSKEEGSAFIDYLYAQGIELGVKWSANASQIAAYEGAGRFAA